MMLFSEFAHVYESVTKLALVNEISAFINKYVKEENKNELYVWLYLMSTFDKKFKINDKHILTVFCKIQEPHIDRKNLQEAFKLYGVAQTCSTIIKLKINTSPLTMVEVYEFLQKLHDIPSKSCHLLKHFKKIVFMCDKSTLYCLINIIRNSNRNKKLQTKKRNLYLFRQVLGQQGLEKADVLMNELKKKNINMKDCIKPGKPIESMLAQPCKFFECINFNSMCVEIKYNGERIQVHKFKNTVICYKRNMNINQKCIDLTPKICKVLQNIDNIILDCELVGTCIQSYQIIVFDVLYFNGHCLINESLQNRKIILTNAVFVEDPQITKIQYEVSNDKVCVEKWVKTILKLENIEKKDDDIEGVVIKDWDGVYEPKRKKWLKIKKSYFQNVCSADLVVVGGWKNEKSITIYLVATPFYDYNLKRWLFLPVSKVKYSKNNYEHYMKPYNKKECNWLVADEHLRILDKIPNMVAKDPLMMPVWEMEGDFIRSDKEWVWNNITRNYVSIRLPRFIRLREDKTFRQANTIFDLLLMSSITNKSFKYPELYNFFIKNNIKNYSPN
ncbi:DNA ligase [Choristoneura occidentalis granulovirus]|uniref:DNA ligase n=1 Tax=Choristoneura occidentalis granulovirus TaxID=364745 RepID=Q1A4J7_9BBAC|nr:DNA ligase [Choristoneura fumiferana granulovirus]ABC61233.1 DNA ligase [Choristoneura fumiferana granulovirus]